MHSSPWSPRRNTHRLKGDSPGPARRYGVSALVAALLSGVLVAAWLARPHPAPAEPPQPTNFEQEVRPVLAQHCIACHNEQKHKGGVNLEAALSEPTVGRQRRLWRKVARQVESQEMPAAGQPPLEGQQRQQLLQALQHTLSVAEETGTPNPGRAPLRRLSRSEYNRTLRDLVGIDLDAATVVGMPEDVAGSNFANLADALNLPPALMEKYFAAADKVLDQVFAAAPGIHANPPPSKKAQDAYRALFVVRPGNGVTERDAARQVITRFARRAYRRPLEDSEVERLLKLYDLAAERQQGFDRSVRLVLKAVLVSPHFLFRIEQDRAPEGSTEPYRLSDHELAVRLSYFLWSSMPDDQLETLADQHQLSDPAVLEQQVRRMLADPKARALTEDFAVQWLQLGKLAEARPSTEFFPTFNQQLRQAMYDETTTFFDKLREEDRSILDLLDADYTYVNGPLAKHYNLAGVEGPQLRRVTLKPGDHRGGLLGMGSILAMTSHTSRTSPTLRGKWVLDVIFGTPPPPPPPDVGKIDENQGKGKEPKTFRELLALHAHQATCAACHARIDPLGFGLDSYDAVGRWREEGSVPVLDTSGRLPGGQTFHGADELKQVIVQRRGEFVRNLAERLLTYALGQELQETDDRAVQEVIDTLGKNDHHFSALVLGVVRSYPFQYRRNGDS